MQVALRWFYARSLVDPWAKQPASVLQLIWAVSGFTPEGEHRCPGKAAQAMPAGARAVNSTHGCMQVALRWFYARSLVQWMGQAACICANRAYHLGCARNRAPDGFCMHGAAKADQRRQCQQEAELPIQLHGCMQVALRWFYARSLVRQQGLNREHIDRIPGKQTDRKTPLGELNWIFTAVTDTIAWNLLPRALFQRLFRQVPALSGHLSSQASWISHQACKLHV